MYRVWVVIPTADWVKGSAMLHRWRDLGYRTCAVIDRGTERPAHTDRVIELEEYKGYPAAFNAAWRVLKHTGPDIVIGGSDDIHPPRGWIAEQLAVQFYDRFGEEGFGCMFPMGDDDANVRRGAGVAPWFGSGYLKRVNGGNGPLWEGYAHFWNDDDCYAMAHRLGVAWDRLDLDQYHEHWTRTGRDRPPHMHKWAAKWGEDQQEFKRREAEGFPAFLVEQS